MLRLEDIEKAKYITILTDNNSFGDASALYTHILRLHKKVSLVCLAGEIEYNLSCVPWYEKVKKLKSSSSDLIIDMKIQTDSLYEFFIINEISINKKMATALYVSYLKKYNCFFNTPLNGTIFASISELILFGAEYKICNNKVMKSYPVSLFRLKSILFKDMILRDNASVAIFHISKKNLQETGASLNEALIIMKEALNIVNVKVSILLDKDNENKLLQYKEI